MKTLKTKTALPVKKVSIRKVSRSEAANAVSRFLESYSVEKFHDEMVASTGGVRAGYELLTRLMSAMGLPEVIQRQRAA